MDTKKKIEEIIEAEYKEYGFEVRAKVDVSKFGEITIYLNHEDPYMGAKFWKFLNTLEDKLNVEYEKKDGKYFYSYYIMYYVKR